MSRIINPDSAGKERNRLSRAVVLAVRELAKQTQPGAESRDLAAFMVLALSTISETIDISVAAWEKRGYWVKADKFRMEWSWSALLAKRMELAVKAEDWENVAQASIQVGQKLNKVTVPAGHHLGRPWAGAWLKLQKR